MKKTLSIKDTKEFQKVLKRGKWYNENFICVCILPNKRNRNDIGLAIGKKVGKAAKRNYVKRLIRASYTIMEDRIKTGYYILFVWRSKADVKEVTFHKIQKDMEKAFQKAGIKNMDIA